MKRKRSSISNTEAEILLQEAGTTGVPETKKKRPDQGRGKWQESGLSNPDATPTEGPASSSQRKKWRNGSEKNAGVVKSKLALSSQGGETGSQAAPLSSNWLQLRTELKLPTVPRASKQLSVTVGHGKSRPQDKGPADAQPKLPVKTPKPLSSNQSVTKVLAMDCEMVGVGLSGKRSMLAHVCLVNSHGNVVYEKHVRAMEEVTDYRTFVSGVRPRDLKGPAAADFWSVQKEVAQLLRGRILVGHALHNDLKALLLSHPKKDTRDTQKFRPAGKKKGRSPSLRGLAKEVLGLTIQEEEHSPADDARAALYLYLHYKVEWERSLQPRSKQQAALGNNPKRSP